MKIVCLKSGWCSQCPAQTKELERLAELDDTISIEMFDVDLPDGAELAKAWNIRGIPFTAILDENEEVLYSKSGLWKAEDILTKMGELK